MAINFKRLEDIARSLKRTEQTGKSYHCCFVYLGNKLIKIGQNNYTKLHRSHKLGNYKSFKNNSSNYIAGIHAEIDAAIRLGETDCSDYKFINIRIDNNGNSAISKPCKNCERILRELNVKRIIYFDGKKYITERYY